VQDVKDSVKVTAAFTLPTEVDFLFINEYWFGCGKVFFDKIEGSK